MIKKGIDLLKVAVLEAIYSPSPVIYSPLTWVLVLTDLKSQRMSKKAKKTYSQIQSESPE